MVQVSVTQADVLLSRSLTPLPSCARHAEQTAILARQMALECAMLVSVCQDMLLSAPLRLVELVEPRVHRAQQMVLLCVTVNQRAQPTHSSTQIPKPAKHVIPIASHAHKREPRSVMLENVCQRLV